MSNHDQISVIVVARHGERLDYVSRDAGINWVATAPKPYDPPLTEHGKEQAGKMGKHLAKELKSLGFPSVSAIYTSPLLRCRQTSIEARKGLEMATTSVLPVRVELGLAESINQAWYRSWSLPGSDGTWGYRVNGEHAYDPDTVHPLAKQPVQSLLHDWKRDESVDQTYEPKTALAEPYCFHPALLETSHQNRLRMKHVVTSVSEVGTTVVLVSHGGPVTHLYEELTGNPWYVHGESTYCCYSIYKKSSAGCWEPVQVNESNYLHEHLRGDQYISDADE